MHRLRALLSGARGDALWLFASQVVALVVTFVATPIELERMGAQGYGFVVVLTAAVGYVGLLDLGAGWAVVRFVPWYRERGNLDAVQRVVTAGLLVTLGLGVAFGAATFAAAAPVSSLFEISASARGEAEAAIRVGAVTVPFLLLTSLYMGLGRAVGMFPLVGIVSAAQVVVLNVVWVAVAGSEDDVLKVVVAQVLISAGAVITLAAALGVRRGWAVRPRLPDRASLREVTTFGAKTSTGQAGLGLITAVDKPVLASVIAVSSVPAYSIPFALAMRITLVSSSVASAIFPRTVAALARDDDAEFAHLRRRSIAVVGLLGGLLVVNCVFGGRPLLEWWLGESFAMKAWAPLSVLALGFGLLALGSIANVLLDAAGRPGKAAAIFLAGGATGLALAGVFGATWESPVAASAGTAAGLLLMGTASMEYARRLRRPVTRLRTFVDAFSSWLPLAACGLALRGGCEALALPGLPTVAVVAAGTSAVAWVAYRRLGSTLAAATPRSTSHPVPTP